jgi:hypothetical protein
MTPSTRTLLVLLTLSSTAAIAQKSKAQPLKNAGKIAVLQDADYTIVQQKVLIKPAYTGFVLTPMQVATVTEQEMVVPAHREGAEMETVVEQVLLQPEGKRKTIDAAVWQRNIKTIVTKETCNNERPETQTYTEQVLQIPETTREIDTPAEYKTTMKRVVRIEGTGAPVPATYKTTTRKVIKTPEIIREVQYPAEYQTFDIKKCKFPDAPSTRATIAKIAKEKSDSVAAALQAILDAPVPQKVLIKPTHNLHEPIAAQYRTTSAQMLKTMGHREGAIMKTISEQVLVKDATKKIEILPAIWLPVKKTIVTKQACNGQPQTTHTYIEQVLVTPEKIHETEIPAEYKTFFSEIVVTDGAGAAVYGEYQTITSQRVETPAGVRIIEIPDEYQTFEVKMCR